MEPKANFKNILEAVRHDIRNNMPAGTFLPTETELAARYNVSRPTIAKVYNTLQKEGYVLKKQGIGTTVIYQGINHKTTFGLLLSGPGESEIFATISDRFMERSQKGDFECIWNGATSGNAEIRRDLTEKSCEEYIEQKVDGIFFAPLERIPQGNELNNEICRRIREAGIPLVLIDRDIVEFPDRSEFDLVSLDNLNAAYTMAEHLISAGCDHLLFCFRPDSAGSVRIRQFGVSAAAQKQGFHFGSENVCCGNPEDMDFVRELDIRPGHTGIVCANDATAAVLMSSLGARGIKIMSDALLCAFDDMKYAKHLKYTLTSYRQPCEQITDVAIELMLRRMKTPDAPALTINLQGEICPRDSSRFAEIE